MRALGGALLLTLGTLGAFVQLISFIDPVGTQMADDSSPFGAPVPRYLSAIALAFCCRLAWWGYRTFRRIAEE